MFPLEKLKTLRIFTQIWSLQEAEPPSPPLTKGKIFFAFLDVSDYLEAKKKKKKLWKITRFQPPSPSSCGKFHTFFFFSFLNTPLTSQRCETDIARDLSKHKYTHKSSCLTNKKMMFQIFSKRSFLATYNLNKKCLRQ